MREQRSEKEVSLDFNMGAASLKQIQSDLMFKHNIQSDLKLKALFGSVNFPRKMREKQ